MKSSTTSAPLVGIAGLNNLNELKILSTASLSEPGAHAMRGAQGRLEDYLHTLSEAWEAHLALRQPDAPTVVSLFAGAGGSSLGYSMAGFAERLAVEWDDDAIQTFRINFPSVPVYHGDIAELSVEQTLNMAHLQPGELDVLDG